MFKKLVKPTAAETNLCMFYAIYNALPSEKLKIAFSGRGITENERIEELFTATVLEYKSKEEIEEDEYTERDLTKYLKHLVKQNVLNAFCWKRKKPKTNNFHKIWINPPQRDEIYVLFGYCTTN